MNSQAWVLASLWAEVGFALPLLVAISLVYAATRHELWPNILRRALRVFLWTSGLLLAMFVALQSCAARL